MTVTSTVFIAAIASDIGRALARLYRQRGFDVVGTYRSEKNLGDLRDDSGITLIACDVVERDSIRRAADAFAQLDQPWRLFIGAVGQLDPIGPFFDCDIDDWTASVAANSLGQIALLHALYPHRDVGSLRTKVAFLVGGGINGPFRNYSAYCLGKLMLVKFCELIDDEYPDLHAIAIGTGWVNTKIHQQTLAAGDSAGSNFRRTFEFVNSGQAGTEIEDILACMEWCFEAGKETTSGRNVSVVHDGWKSKAAALASSLAVDGDLYKLRRKGA
jgi:NAD(P)-dependent dehydrogenase (short-subunit alcohol dehydrogenase family)